MPICKTLAHRSRQQCHETTNPKSHSLRNLPRSLDQLPQAAYLPRNKRHPSSSSSSRHIHL
ncbi:uncharacterized protein TrAFT101_000332 [Trichoderma asperellum]|uniref:uncharacterized protein n=1 Tax=Trichoderma asperellum TaxID=101201 RepID=UPI0033315889|nr:hypothetical protein TrAFT101_000332 [Trichoderma asperellum]